VFGMMPIVEILYMLAGVLLAVGALFAVIRIVKGPSILDRVIASDVLLTTFILVIGTEMVINNHSRTIPIMVVLAATAAFATIAVARYVSKQDAPATPGDDGLGPEELPK
jgi:multicomponent Na+:H+ antiporter subunit F